MSNTGVTIGPGLHRDMVRPFDRIEVEQLSPVTFRLPCFGMLEGIEAYLPELLPNMDVAAPYTLTLELRTATGRPLQFDRVFTRARWINPIWEGR